MPTTPHAQSLIIAVYWSAGLGAALELLHRAEQIAMEHGHRCVLKADVLAAEADR